MAKSKINNTTIPGDDELETRELPVLGNGNSASDAADENSVNEIEAVLKANELEGGILRLNRRGPTDHSYVYVVKMPVKDFDIDYIKKVYGGGDYKAQTWRANGQIYKKFEFSIDGRFTGHIDPKAALESGGKSSANSAQDAMAIARMMNDNQQKGPDMTQMMTMMQKSSSENMQMMVMMMQQSSQQMMAMMQAMGQTMAAAMAKPVGPDNSSAIMPVLIEMIRAGNNKGGASAGPSLLEQVETLKLLKEIANPSGGKDDDDDEKEPSMMERLAKVAVPLLFGGNFQMPVLPTASVNNPPQTAAAPQVQVVTQVSPDEQQRLSQTNGMMTQLLGAAERDSDPGLYHDLTMESQSIEQLPALKQLLERDDYIQLLYNFDQALLVRAIAKKAWFDTLRTQLLESINEALKPA